MENNNDKIYELTSENNALKREITDLKRRLVRMQTAFQREHEEIHKLQTKLGTRPRNRRED